MGLQEAHEGYEYQDLLITYFLLLDMIDERNGRFLVDKKESKNDSIDDVTIFADNGKYKKQVKYSNSDSAHTLKKDDLSNGVICIDQLLQTWLSVADDEKLELRLCLAWNHPDNSLTNILTELKEKGTFKKFNTKTYQINADNLWPENEKPLTSWIRFNRFVHDEKVPRDRFVGSPEVDRFGSGDYL